MTNALMRNSSVAGTWRELLAGAKQLGTICELASEQPAESAKAVVGGAGIPPLSGKDISLYPLSACFGAN